MMSRLAFVAAFCVFVTGPVIALEIDKEAVQKETNKLAEAISRGDMAALASMYSDDAYLLPPQAGVVRGRNEIQQYWKSASEQIGDLRLTTLDVKDLGPNTARAIGTYSLKTKGQQQEEVTGKYVLILQAAGNEWKIITDIWNTDK